MSCHFHQSMSKLTRIRANSRSNRTPTPYRASLPCRFSVFFTDFEPTTPETNFGISTSPADVTSVSCITNPYSLEDVPSLWERTSNFIEANEQPQWILIAPAAWMWTVPHHHSSLCVLKSVAHWAGSRQRRALFQRRSTFVTR